MHIIFTYNVLNRSNGYKFGFNGKENIEEIDGWQDYGMRMYNRLIGRFPSPDPLIVYEQQYPELSSYQFASNNPIRYIDLDGLEAAEPQQPQDNLRIIHFQEILPPVTIYPSPKQKPWYIKVRDFFRGKSGFNVTSPDGLSSNQAPDEYRTPEKNVDGDYLFYLKPNTGPRPILGDKFYLRKPDAIAKGIDNSTKIYSEVVEQIPSSNIDSQNKPNPNVQSKNENDYKDSIDIYKGNGEKPYRFHIKDTSNSMNKGRQLSPNEKEIVDLK